MGRDVPQHHIGSPVPGTPPTNNFDSQWSPLNPGSAPFQGDPWSRPHAENPPDANYGGWQAPQWGNGVGSNLRAFDVSDWTVDKKAPNELKSFNGVTSNYDNWRRRIRDHYTQTNRYYKEMLDLVENEKGTIPWAKLATLKVATLPKLDSFLTRLRQAADFLHCTLYFVLYTLQTAIGRTSA
jgi:hypothetical protein